MGYLDWRQSKLIVFFFFLILVPGTTEAWFMHSEWSLIKITQVNQLDVSPDSDGNAPDGGTLHLPVTVRVSIEKSPTYEIPVRQMYLQYSTTKDGSVWENWKTFGVQWDRPDNELEVLNDRTFLGQNTLTGDMVTPGSDVAVRLYAANESEGHENADKTVNTTSEGINGWKDFWVYEFTAAEGEYPSPDGNIFDRLFNIDL